jgi:hypothetical protein
MASGHTGKAKATTAMVADRLPTAVFFIGGERLNTLD